MTSTTRVCVAFNYGSNLDSAASRSWSVNLWAKHGREPTSHRRGWDSSKDVLCISLPDPNGAAFAFLSPWQVWCTGRQGFFSRSRRVWDFCHPPDRSLFLDSKYVVTGTDLDLVLPDPADLLYHSVSKSLMELWFRHSSFQASVCTPASHVHVPELKARGSYLQSDNKGPYWIKDLDVHQISSRVVLCFGHATKKAAKCSNRAKSKRLVFAVVLSAKECYDTSMLQTTFDYSWSMLKYQRVMASDGV